MCRRRYNRQPLLMAAGIAAINAIEERQRNRQALIMRDQAYPEQTIPAAYDRDRISPANQVAQAPAYDLEGLVRNLSLQDEKAVPVETSARELPPAYSPRDSQQTIATEITQPRSSEQKPSQTYKDLLTAVPLLSRHATNSRISGLINDFVSASEAQAVAQRQANGSCCGLGPQRRRVKWARKALVREVMGLENTRLGGRGNSSACGIRGYEAKRSWRDGRRGLKMSLRGFEAGCC